MTHKELKTRWQEKHHFPFIDMPNQYDSNITIISETILPWEKVLNVSENKHFQVTVIAYCRSEKRNSGAIQWISSLNKSTTFDTIQGGILAGSCKIHPSIQKN